jgi:hypothetical protein
MPPGTRVVLPASVAERPPHTGALPQDLLHHAEGERIFIPSGKRGVFSSFLLKKNHYLSFL